MRNINRIALGGDHAGFTYKKELIQHLSKLGYLVEDFGPSSTDSVDYPDYVHPLTQAVESGEVDLGIVICGSGNGVAITANKHQGIRAALCWNEELAALARQHNDANVLAIPARFITYELAQKLVEIFISTSFEGGRHQGRVSKISCS